MPRPCARRASCRGPWWRRRPSTTGGGARARRDPEVPEADVVVTEGNYLLLADPDWEPVRQCLDEVWFCALDDEERRDRLITRHVDAGRTPETATEWVDRSDEANARLVSPTAAGADVMVVDGTPR